MIKEKSCGGIILKGDKVLLIKHVLGHYGFPKGHQEEGETDLETAIREIKEETNADVKLISNETIMETYCPKEGVLKDVIYFFFEATNNDFYPQEEEAVSVEYMSIKDLKKLIQFEDFDKLFEMIYKIKE